jgi:hypothetical protein
VRECRSWVGGAKGQAASAGFEAYTAGMNAPRPNGPLAALLALMLALAVGLVGCSGDGREGATPAASAPMTPSAPSAPSAPSTSSVPADAAEGRAGSAAPPRSVEDREGGDATAAMRADIVRLVGDAACTDDTQCRALPLGSKPCGGPEAYIAWSTAGTDAGQLEALAQRYKQARTARNQQLGLVSDCAVVPEPPVRCVRVTAGASTGRCTALAARGGPMPATR